MKMYILISTTILTTTFFAGFASAETSSAACPSFSMKQYTCTDTAGKSHSIELSLGQDGKNRSAVLFNLDNKGTVPIACLNGQETDWGMKVSYATSSSSLSMVSYVSGEGTLSLEKSSHESSFHFRNVVSNSGNEVIFDLNLICK